MARPIDIAAYIVEQRGDTFVGRLHAILYFAQACHIAQKNMLLFDEDIIAYPEGPVVHDLLNSLGKYISVVLVECGFSSLLTPEERESVNCALELYGGMPLMELTRICQEQRPWRAACKGLFFMQKAYRVISPHDMSNVWSTSIAAYALHTSSLSRMEERFADIYEDSLGMSSA